MSDFERNRVNNEAIVSYFNDTRFHYQVWMTSALAMHMGYWNDHTRKHSEALRNMNKAVAERISWRPGMRVLDAGCGVGGSAIWLAQRYNAHVVGLNLVRSQVDDARRHARRNGVEKRVRFEIGDIVRTRFADSTFDVIWAIESICHTGNKAEFLAEAARLLVPGGWLLIADGFRRARQLNPADERLLKDWLTGWAVPDLLTREEFITVAKEMGFAEPAFQDVTSRVRPSLRRLYYTARVCHPLGVALLHPLGLLTRGQLANAKAALEQYEALQRNLWGYGILAATPALRGHSLNSSYHN
jgi:tocopherol O-methyltransferase